MVFAGDGAASERAEPKENTSASNRRKRLAAWNGDRELHRIVATENENGDGVIGTGSSAGEQDGIGATLDIDPQVISVSFLSFISVTLCKCFLKWNSAKTVKTSFLWVSSHRFLHRKMIIVISFSSLIIIGFGLWYVTWACFKKVYEFQMSANFKNNLLGSSIKV